MPINVMKRFIGGASVILAYGKKQDKKLEVLLHYNGQDTKNIKNVNSVGSKHMTRHNWMCCL